MTKPAVISLSGGMDSSTLLLRLLKENYTVTAIAFNYGQKHKFEIQQAASLVKYLNQQGFYINFQTISLDGLSSLLHSNLVSGGGDIPTGHYQEQTMKLTVVPNRNKIFSSIIQAVALSIANTTSSEVRIALGIHSGDHAIYPDCREAFRNLDYQAFLSGNWDAEKVVYYTPYLNFNKTEILKDGIELCNSLKLPFNEIYKRTLTSYAPIKINNHWYSDYKSSSSVERIEAFINNNISDPILYADQDGPKSWPFVVEKVQKVLSKSLS
jgi:7-cyano-7-deazaguanine synthase